ncbi:MAG: FtsW/RodA/SpoVE family cell cycle protein [Chthonomonadales bacterium]
MRAPDQGRRAEGSLLALVCAILTAGAVLVFLARTSLRLPTDAINLNTASADDLSLNLQIEPDLAQDFVRFRVRNGGFASVRQAGTVPVLMDAGEVQRVKRVLARVSVPINKASASELSRVLSIPIAAARRIAAFREELPGGFHKPEDAVAVPLLDARVLADLGPRLIVRTPAQVLWEFLLTGVVLSVVTVLLAGVLRAAGVRGDPFLIPISILLSGLGVITLFSLRDPLRDAPVYIHHAYGILMGLGVFTAAALLPPRRAGGRWLPGRMDLRRYTYLWAVCAIVLMVALWLFGRGPQGVRLSLGPVQPMELIKVLLVLFLAGYLTEHGGDLAHALHRWRRPSGSRFGWLDLPRTEDMGPIAVMYGVCLGLFAVIRDLGPALLLFGVFLAVFYIATNRISVLWIGTLLAGAGAAIAYVLHFGVIPVRVDMWLSPWKNAHSNGSQLGHALWALASGGFWGTGLGLGAANTLPRGRDDLVFAAAGEQLGFAGLCIILVLYLVLFGRGWRIALHAHSDFERLLAGGLTCLLALQTLLIMGGVCGLIPLSGITLPFMAYGNSSLMADFFILGILRGISSPTPDVPVGSTNPLFRRGLRRLADATALGMLGFILLGRLLPIQVGKADEIASALLRTPDADGQVRAKVNPRLTAVERDIVRGSIYDRKGRVLATSRLNEISSAIFAEPGASDHPVDTLKEVRRTMRKRRYYPHGSALAHLVGYVDPAFGGPVGAEKEFNLYLRGFTDYRELVADFRAKDLPGYAPRRGSDVYLTVDAALQEDVMRILAKRTTAGGGNGRPSARRHAAMVVLDPVTGEILALASIPSFDPNTLTPRRWARLAQGGKDAGQFLDRARFGAYPPGSTLKIATAACALEEGLDPVFDCNHTAYFRWRSNGTAYGPRRISDDDGDPPHNHIRMARALRVSCNLYFANLGIRLGASRLREYLAGQLRLKGIKPQDVFAASLPENAFGQGTVTASPLELARMAAAVANRGVMMQPNYLLKVVSPEGRVLRAFTPIQMARPMGELNARRLAGMMRSVVTDGTAAGIFDRLPVEVAGKTGTAQTSAGDTMPHSWFIGYTPFTRPRYAFACIIEHGGYGRRSAAPAVRDVLTSMFGRR